MSLDLTGEQKFQAGLLQARTPGNFEQILFQPARQRLNFERSGDGLSVVTGSGQRSSASTIGMALRCTRWRKNCLPEREHR
jgi:hypothetical protein